MPSNILVTCWCISFLALVSEACLGLEAQHCRNIVNKLHDERMSVCSVDRHHYPQLLQGRIQGYLYNIQSDSDYSERISPPSPERPPSPSFAPPRASRWGPNPSAPVPYLTSFFSSPSMHSDPRSYTHPHPQPSQDLAAQWRTTAQHYFGNSSSQLQSQTGSRAIVRPSASSVRQQQQQHQQAGTSGAARVTTTGCSSKCRQAWQIMHSKGTACASEMSDVYLMHEKLGVLPHCIH